MKAEKDSIHGVHKFITIIVRLHVNNQLFLKGVFFAYLLFNNHLYSRAIAHFVAVKISFLITKRVSEPYTQWRRGADFALCRSREPITD